MLSLSLNNISLYKVNALFVVTKHLHTARKLLQFEVQQEN